MLVVPPEWNEVPDLMMEEEDVLLKTTRSTNGGEMKSSEGRENGGRKTISSQRNEDILPQYPGEYKIQSDFI